MKIQRKLLTKEQKQQICDNHSVIWDEEDGTKYCDLICPLRANISNGIGGTMDCSCKHINIIENSIKDYWNEEIELMENEQ